MSGIFCRAAEYCRAPLNILYRTCDIGFKIQIKGASYMKKIIAIVLALSMAVTLVACGTAETDTGAASDTSVVSSVQ